MINSTGQNKVYRKSERDRDVIGTGLGQDRDSIGTKIGTKSGLIWDFIRNRLGIILGLDWNLLILY